MKKILFTDLDGTLLNRDSVVTGRMKTALDDFCAAGNILVLSSGRPLKSIEQVKKTAGIDDLGRYIIANNGSLIYDCEKDREICRKGISVETVREVWDLCYGEGIHVQTYLKDAIVAKEPNRELEVYTSKIHLDILYCSEPDEVLTEPPCKMLAVQLTDHERLAALQRKIQDRMGDRLQTVFSNPEYLEIFNKDAGKGNALRWFCSYLNIPVENSYAAGDAENDISMIQAAGTSIAMKNGDEKLKQVADIVTEKTNHECGLADVIYNEILK